MKRYTFALAAATPVPVQVMGEFFLLDAAPLGGVKVEFFGPSGLRRDELIEDGLESMYARLDKGFTSIKLTSTLAQSVSFYVARGALGVNRFSGSSDVTDRAARLLGVVNGPRALSAGPVLADWPVLSREIGFAYSAAFGSVTAKAGNAPETIFTAAANVNGAIVWSAFYSTKASPSNTILVSILAKATAPATVIDGDVILADGAKADDWTHGVFRGPVFIAAGKGLFRICNLAEGVPVVSALYTLL